jgi:N-alpha-acetyltransferase 30
MTDLEIEYVDYIDETMMTDIQRLVSKDLSEPYSIYTYRYFLHGWPNLCICVYAKDPNCGERVMIGVIVSKAEHDGMVMQGYIAMLAVDSRFRGRGIGSKLVQLTIDRMVEVGCNEIVLETEVSVNNHNYEKILICQLYIDRHQILEHYLCILD